MGLIDHELYATCTCLFSLMNSRVHLREFLVALSPQQAPTRIA